MNANVDGPYFQTKHLKASPSSHAYAVYKAALEWSLTDPIVLDGRDDFCSEPTWRDRVEPFHHQVTNLITFCRRLPVTLLADDVGLGKTISAGLIASELISRRRIRRILVVAPKLLGPQWKEELETRFNVPSVIAPGRKLIDAQPAGDVGAVITTYHAARAHIEKLPEDRFQMLILDEAHKLRNLYGVPDPPQVALRFRKALEERLFRYVLMLTATPIQNRLWDLYSLVELLSIARGHDNPFGGAGMFARNFIADNRTQARQLKPEARDQFRSIVYSYMSRVRRGDAELHFPQRLVLSRDVRPTANELVLIRMLVGPLRTMNRLIQISLLQALTSSPDALAAQVSNMARRGTFPQDVAQDIRSVVKSMPPSAKLEGLATLVDLLRQENPETWRMVVFTQRRETQTTIEAYLAGEGISVGIINGETAAQNPKTLADFRCSPPKLHVIVSTEAGSEGINLQAANVLVNFDLPWNPMIVEQRIGRVQRLASEHAKVSVYNVILSGTFEEFIVARLMEKLQMAAHAIGDIEALLEASGVEGESGETAGFEEEIRRLVMASLEGKDVQAATMMAVESIEKAKAKLTAEAEHIDALLGGTDGLEEQDPKTPCLPPIPKSMELRAFVPAAYRSLGARVTAKTETLYTVDFNGRSGDVFVSEDPTAGPVGTVVCAPGTSAFDRLVSRLTETGLHDITDLDDRPCKTIESVCHQWVFQFDAIYGAADITEVRLAFSGTATLNLRATVAHDSFERLITVDCSSSDQGVDVGIDGLAPLKLVLEDPTEYGIDAEALTHRAARDPAVAEFCRFYKERRARELRAVFEDERKRHKLYEDFTPRIQVTLVGLEGTVHRLADVRVVYTLDGHDYSSLITVRPFDQSVVGGGELETCDLTGRQAPPDALDRCVFSGQSVFAHLLATSDTSGRRALPVHLVRCEHTGQRVLDDEIEISALTKRRVVRSAMKRSAVSGLWAETEDLQKCAFTGIDALPSELQTSNVSGKPYRIDQAARSVVCGRVGHRSEFIQCVVSKQHLLAEEADRCDVTGKPVMPGQLDECQISRKRVLPSELGVSALSGRRAISDHICQSSISQMVLLEDEVVRSTSGKVCAPSEAINCSWSGVASHPNDLSICPITGLGVRANFLSAKEPRALSVLATLLKAPQPHADRTDEWPRINDAIGEAFNGAATIEAAQLAPDGSHIAFSGTLKQYWGLKTRIIGGVYDLRNDRFVGRLAIGTRRRDAWFSA